MNIVKPSNSWRHSTDAWTF